MNRLSSPSQIEAGAATGESWWPRATLHRVFAILALVLAGTWAWAAAMLWHHARQDEAFAREHVAPEFEKARKQDRAWDQALRERRDGKITPLPKYEPMNMAPLEESMRRSERRNRYWTLRTNATIGLMATAFGWMIAGQILLARRRRQWEAADRPPAAEAGTIIAEVVRGGVRFVAKAPRGREVVVDGQRAVVAFRHFAFVRSFVDNPVREVTEVPFTDLIAGSLYFDKGRGFFRLRTTAGAVVIDDRVQPFERLVNLLTDAAELNRTWPEQYRAMVAREPVVRTPWWGWLIVAIAVGLVVGAFKYLVWS